MALTTLFGTAQLAVQQQLAASISTRNGVSSVPNFLVVSLRRDDFRNEHPGAVESARDEFRRGIEEAAGEYIRANGWRVGGTGTLIANIVLRAIPRPCEVEVRTVDKLYELELFDDRGIRRQPVRMRVVRVGRSHEGPPPGFVALHDNSRSFSREHLLLRYTDLQLIAHLTGQNPTTINGQVMERDDPVVLRKGDVIACGSCKVVVV